MSSQHFSQSQISVFRTAFTSEPEVTASLLDALEEIKSDEHKAIITKLRALKASGDEKGYSAKKRELPAFCISGTCTTRAANKTIDEKFTKHSGYLQIDLDGKDNPALVDEIDEIRKELRECEHVAAYFISPSGDGLKVVLRVPESVNAHKGAWLAAERLFDSKWGLTIDKSTKDPLRLCFLSWDPEAWWRDADSVPITPIAEEPEHPAKPKMSLKDIAKSHRETTAADIAEILTFIPTRPDYETWLRVASAVWTVLDEAEGTRLLEAWSPAEQQGEYHAKYQKRLHQVGVGTLVRYAKQNGFDAVLAARRANWCGRAYFGSMLKKAQETDAEKLSDNQAETRVEDYIGSDIQPREMTNEFLWKCFSRGQRGDAELFAAKMQGIYLYDINARAWRKYIDGIWQKDDAGATTIEFCETVCAEYAKLARECEDGSDGLEEEAKKTFCKKIGGRIDKLNSRVYAANALKFASEMMPAEAVEFDSCPYLIAVENGAIDLKNCDFTPLSPLDMATQRLPVKFDLDAQCPQWEKFIDSIFDGNEETIAFVRRCVGLSLSGITGEDKLFFLIGTGANGKSVFRKAIEMLFGEVATSIKIETLLAKTSDNNIDYQKALLKGKRVAFTDEIPENKRFNESQIKAITGRDKIIARSVFEKPYAFEPTHKLWLIGNHKPTIVGTDNGIWRRLCIIPFNVVFDKSKQVKAEVFEQRFRSELSGILNWALRGWCDYRANGLSQPKEVAEATDEYRTEQDQVSAFIEEDLVKSPGGKIQCLRVYKAYSEWCSENGEFPVCKTKNKLTSKLREMGYEIEAGRSRYNWLHGYELAGDSATLPFGNGREGYRAAYDD